MTLLEQLLVGTNVALKVLQARLVVLICLAMTMVLFSWAMWLGTQLGIIIAGTWAVLVFLPVLFIGAERHAPKHPAAEPQSIPAGSAQSQPGRRTNRNDLEERDLFREAAS